MTRLSVGTIVVYWFTLIAGLVVYSATHAAAAEVDTTALWSGVLLGTGLGQICAHRRMRVWLLAVIVLGILMFIGPFKLTKGDILFWMTFVPATFCGWASLSDRGSLFAFWFPAVIWMLSILDHGAGALKLDGGSGALLGGLAFMFIAFMYARETRRVSMWRTISPLPIAESTPPAILREVPRFKLGVTGWGLIVSSSVFAITAYMAPKLWHVEPLVPELHAAHAPNANAPRRLPCCKSVALIETKRARVKEYLDIGQGHDGDVEELPPTECVVCNDKGVPVDLGYTYEQWVARYGTAHGYPGYGGYRYPDEGTTTYGDYGSYSPPSYTPPSTYSPPSYTPPSTYSPPAYTPEPYAPQPYTPPTYTPPAYTPEPYTPPAYVEPPKAEPPKPEPKIAAKPEPPKVEPPIASIEPKIEPKIEPQIEPPKPPPPKAESPDVVAVPAPSSGTVQSPNTRVDAGPPFLQWILVALAGALALQMLVLGLRPVRRVLTLRHLRKPFWNETVDQRVSNWWHLVLVGLRDAGWRTTSGEAPRELAKRLQIDGVERAATILERARHGIGIDKTDLDEMGKASEAAYHASRAKASSFQRLLGWFRRPLV